MDYVRRTYGVPAKRGMRVTYGKIGGVIVGASHYVHVRLDAKKKIVARIHPTDPRLVYEVKP